MSSIQEINQSIAQADIEFRNKYPELSLPTIENTTPLQLWIDYHVQIFEEAAIAENVPTNKIDNWIKHKLLNCVRKKKDVPTFEFDHDPVFQDFEEEIEQEYDNMKCAHCEEGVMIKLKPNELQCDTCGHKQQHFVHKPSEMCEGCNILLEGARVCRNCGLEDTRQVQALPEYGQAVSKGILTKGKHGGYYLSTLNTFNLNKNKTKEILKQKIYDYLHKKGFNNEEIQEIIQDHTNKMGTIKKIIELLIKKNIDFDIENIVVFFGFTNLQSGKLLMFHKSRKKK